MDIVGVNTAGSATLSSTAALSDAGATSVTVTGLGSFSGTSVSLGGGTFNTGTLTFNSTGTVSIAEDSSMDIVGTNTASSATLSSTAGISDAGATSIAVTGLTDVNGTSITLGAGGTFNSGTLTFNSSGAVSIAEDSAMDIVGVNTAGTLSLTGVGLSQAIGTITATGPTTVDAGAANVSLTQLANDFQGLFTLNNAATASINDANTITFASPVVLTGSFTITAPNIVVGDVTTNGFQQYNGNVTMASTYLTNNNPFAVTGTTTLENDSVVDIGSSSATFGGAVNADANPADGQETLSIVSGGTATFNAPVGNTQPLGSLSTPTGTTTINGGLVQTTGAQTYNGPTTGNNLTLTSTGGGAITATNGGNDFTGTLNVSGGATQITDANTLTLGTVNATSVVIVNTGALDLGTMTADSLNATSNGGNIAQSGSALITGTTSLNAGSGAVLMDVPLNDFVGMITADGLGGITIVDQNGMVVGTINAGSGSVKLTSGGDITGPGFVTGGSGIFSSTGGTDTQVTGVGITIGGTMTLTGTATLWNFAAGSSAGSFGRTSDTIGVQINGATFLANLVQIQAGNVVGSVAGAAAAVIVDEANKTFGTDSVAEDVEYGFAGEIGATPPMDHRIDESGISLPRCVQESREGLPCK
jgi:hypothetical protein